MGRFKSKRRGGEYEQFITRPFLYDNPGERV